MQIAIVVLALVVATVAAALSLDLSGVARWAVEQQRAFQNEMAGAVRAIRSGELGAWAALLGAAGAYGFVHALGPGHGKYLIGGMGIGSTVSGGRLFGLAMASSIAQAIWAIVLVYGGFFLLEASARQLTSLAEDVLAPLSYAAIGAIGLVLVWRGARALSRQIAERRRRAEHHGHAHDHSHDHGACGCLGHHGPTPEQAARVGSWREAVTLVASIAVRPCTGAMFLLVIAWQMEIQLAGALAVLVMGFGTAMLTGLVAVTSVATRSFFFGFSTRAGVLTLAAPSAQMLAGLLILWFSAALLGLRLG